ncbi:MAG: ROK family protein [Candidatus Paceibacterota bacterium]
MHILFDIGGSKMRVAYTSDLKTFEDPKIVNTPDSFEEGISLFESIAKECAQGRKIEGLAGDVSGILMTDRASLYHSPNKLGWVGKPILSELKKRFDVPVCIENDAGVVGLGEAVHGAGKGHSAVMYITVSTGVGGAKIVNGEIAPHVMGFEPGHQIIDIDNTLCEKFGYQTPGTLEHLVSGSATTHRFKCKPYEIPQSDELWEILASWLGVGISNSIFHWTPDVVVLGGSMIVGDPVILVDRVEHYAKQQLGIYPQMPVFKKAELGAVGGLWGALAMIQKDKTCIIM